MKMTEEREDSGVRTMSFKSKRYRSLSDPNNGDCGITDTIINHLIIL
jgi:hypothetical protein